MSGMRTIEGFQLPRYKEIPNVGLYLEQVAKYINSYLNVLGYADITPSMISNYVKQGLVNKPTGKLYYTDQIVHLFFIAVAKNILSMENIGKLFEMQRKVYTDQVAYDYFCSELENMLYYIFGYKESVDTIGTTDTPEKEMLRSLIIAVAHMIYLGYGFEKLKES